MNIYSITSCNHYVTYHKKLKYRFQKFDIFRNFYSFSSVKFIKSIFLAEIVWLNIIENKSQNVCLHTVLILVQTSFHPFGHHQVLKVLKQCVDKHFAFYLLWNLYWVFILYKFYSFWRFFFFFLRPHTLGWPTGTGFRSHLDNMST
jgi:hypothetical protein